MLKRFSYDYLPFLMSPDTEGANGGESTANTENTDTNGAENGAATGDAGDTGTEKQDEEPSVEDLIAAAVAKEVAGLKKKNTELIDANKKLKEQASQAPQLSDDEFKQFREMQERIARDELLALMASGKSEEAIAIATKRTKAEADAALAAEREARDRAAQEAATARAELEHMKISIALTSAAAPVVKPEYQGLIEKLVGEQVKVVDGAVRVVDAEGEVLQRNGKPLTVKDLIESLRPTYGDLFLATAGGGAGGSSSKTTSPNGGKLSMEAANALSDAEWIRQRNAGKI